MKEEDESFGRFGYFGPLVNYQQTSNFCHENRIRGMEFVSERTRSLGPGQGWMANAEMRGRMPQAQPAGRRAPVSHHMPLSGMVPEAMGYSPSLPDGDYGRGWVHQHGRLELPLADVAPQPSMATPFRGQSRPGTRGQFGYGNQTAESQRSYGGYSLANATQAPESQRSYLSLDSRGATPVGSQRTTPRSAPGGRASSRGATPPPSQRRIGSYSTSSREVGLHVDAPPGLRSHWDPQALPHATTDQYKSTVGGVVPGYGGHVPHAQNHCGYSHVGAVAQGPINSRPPTQREQSGHGEHATRMSSRQASEVAGRVATHVAAASIPGYKGHVPGAETGAFGTSNWNGVDKYGFYASPVSSNAHRDGREPYAGERPRMANLDHYA